MGEADLTASVPGDDFGGETTIADGVIAKIARYTALHTYGIVDMRRTGMDVLRRLFRGSLRDGVEVELHDESIDIGLHVVIENGLNLKVVSSTLEEQVRFAVERITGVTVGQVRVRVEDVRR